MTDNPTNLVKTTHGGNLAAKAAILFKHDEDEHSTNNDTKIITLTNVDVESQTETFRDEPNDYDDGVEGDDGADDEDDVIKEEKDGIQRTPNKPLDAWDEKGPKGKLAMKDANEDYCMLGQYDPWRNRIVLVLFMLIILGWIIVFLTRLINQNNSDNNDSIKDSLAVDPNFEQETTSTNVVTQSDLFT